MKAHKLNQKQAADLALNLLRDRWPNALGAFAGGSVMRGEGKPNSDIDMVVLLPPNARPHRIWLMHHGIQFDLFIHNPDSLRYYIQQGRDERRPVLANLIADAVMLPAPNRRLLNWQSKCKAILEAGPSQLAEKDLLRLRYGLMDAMDDYADAVKHDEQMAVAAQLYVRLCDALCDIKGVWRGSSKWKARQAHKADAPLAAELAKALAADCAAGKADQLLQAGRKIQALCGGPLQHEWLDWGKPNPRLKRLRL